MYKVIKFLPSESVTATTSDALLEKIHLNNESPGEDIGEVFSSKEDAREYIKARHKADISTPWRYRVELA